MGDLQAFYRGKRVFVTGHTGFKGSWLCAVLLRFGAEVRGYSDREHPLFQRAGLASRMRSVTGDIRDFTLLERAVADFAPDIVLHLAAQPLVIEGYHHPRETYETNVMGTVNLLEAVARRPGIQSVVNVTTDKVYRNNEWHWGYREDDALDGFDPYSNSKSCSELVTAAYRRSFFAAGDSTRIATARAGNVIGGGDFAENRIIPDCVRAAQAGKAIVVRNRASIRPWQHVLEPLCGYLMLAKALALGENPGESFNFGPSDEDCVDVGTLVDCFCSAWGEGAAWEYRPDPKPVHEASFLKLDCSLSRAALGWRPRLSVRRAVELSVEWHKAVDRGEPALTVMNKQIGEFYDAR